MGGYYYLYFKGEETESQRDYIWVENGLDGQEEKQDQEGGCGSHPNEWWHGSDVLEQSNSDRKVEIWENVK